ncbi:hypothetical protein [Paenibacillus sp. BC26]|uniref:hypothetical protein n=1 Tax=Paenibacillus sp. BC26 TaxID=1881032 RepID=UPI000B873B3B|nr:hypothetical protein [Paenibacillus sp. BC26]
MSNEIERIIWISAIKPGMEEAFLTELAGADAALKKRLKQQGVETCSVFREGRYLFTYLEQLQGGNGDSAGSQVERVRLWAADEKLSALLETWPSIGGAGGSLELRMNDIFHDDLPQPDVPWRHPDYRPTQRVGSLSRLKPDQYASYVFLHYQLQEEKPRLFNKYYIIGSLGEYIFSYQELPAIVEPPRKGLLSTKETPPDWGVAMEPHFEPWTDKPEAERLWCVMEELFYMGRGE